MRRKFFILEITFAFLLFSCRLIRNPREYMIALQDAAKEVAESSDPSSEKLLQRYDLQVGFEDSLGENAVTPRGLVSSLLNKMVVVEGIVTKCSNVRPKLVKSVQYCPATLKYSSKEYRDNTGTVFSHEILLTVFSHK